MLSIFVLSFVRISQFMTSSELFGFRCNGLNPCPKYLFFDVVLVVTFLKLTKSEKIMARGVRSDSCWVLHDCENAAVSLSVHKCLPNDTALTGNYWQ